MGQLGDWVSAITTTIGLPDPIIHSSHKSSHTSHDDDDVDDTSDYSE